MNFIKKLFNLNFSDENELPERIRINKNNLKEWSKFQKLFDDKKIRFDSSGRLRYLHGAPVGDLILTRFDKEGNPIYKESAEEWFDVDSQKASDFKWI